MNSFLAVFKRELKSYFTTPLAYVFLVIFLFFRNHALSGQFGVPGGLRARVFGLGDVASEVGFSLLLLRDIAIQIGFGLMQGLLVWAAIDLEQEVALSHFLAFGEVDAYEFAGNLRFDGDGGVRFHVADEAQLDRHGPFDCGSDRYRNRRHRGWRGRLRAATER